MKKLIIVFTILVALVGCKKSSSEDLSVKITGKYIGIFYQFSGTGYVEISKQSSTGVNLLGTLMWPATYIESNYSGITLSKGGNGMVLLKYTMAGDTLNGTVNKDSLTYYKNSYLFFRGIKYQFK